jgi:cellobiose epimerase
MSPHFSADRISAEAHAELSALCGWWAGHAVDQQRGGFHGEVSACDAPVPGARKGVVLNARILWFFSEAIAHDGRARPLADRAARYLTAHFLDSEYGGVFWSLDADGAPADRRKHAYAQAFALYALSAYHKATGDLSALEQARTLFALIERHYRDAEHGGYFEARAEDWSAVDDVRLSEVDQNAPKSMNTHLHVLEAYTALHAAAPTADTVAALRHCLELFASHIFDPASGHLRLFFEADWRDRSEAVSFGHDIEASWLIWAAAESLGDARLKQASKPMATALARTALSEGLSERGGLYNERTYAGALDRRSVWWVQAEALVGFLNAYDLTAEPQFLQAFDQVWRFIRNAHLDGGGEWTWWSERDAPDVDRDYKAGLWKCPYHNGRALMETIKRLSHMRRKQERRPA